jgi:hypothetical protein
MLCPDERQPYVIGDYLEGIPHFITNHSCIALSVQSAIEATMVLITRSGTQYIGACETLVRATNHLQLEISLPKRTPHDWAMILLAASLIQFAEVSHAVWS